MDRGCPDGCLFNITKDPTEHKDLSLEFVEIKEAMMARHLEISDSAFQTDCYGQSFNLFIGELCAKLGKRGGVWAPYGFCLSDGSMPKCYYSVAGIFAALIVVIMGLFCTVGYCCRRWRQKKAQISRQSIENSLIAQGTSEKKQQDSEKDDVSLINTVSDETIHNL